MEEIIGAVIEAKLAPLCAQVGRLTSEVEALRKALPPALVTMTEAARLLGLSLSTVRRRVREGILPSCTVGRSVRVDLSGLKPLTDDQVAAEAHNIRAISNLAG